MPIARFPGAMDTVDTAPLRPEGSEPATDAHEAEPFTITVHPEGLSATVQFAEGATLPAQRELEDRLAREFGLKHVDDHGLEAALEAASHGSTEAFVVARGVEPVAGRDGSLEWLCPAVEDNPILLPDGNVDHYRRPKHSVYPGQIIVSVQPPTAGEPGEDVFGRPIPPEEGLPQEVVLDAETVGTQEGDESILIAKVGGVVEWVEPNLSISDVMDVPIVDFSTGSIEFDGAVRVADQVKDKFDIWARGSIEVQGVVGACRLDSGGQITLGQVVGRNGKAQLQARGDIVLGLARQARIKCGGNLVVTSELLLCRTQVEGDLLVEKGRIVEGKHTIGGSVMADVIGSTSHVPTQLLVGSASGEHRRLRRAARRRQKIGDAIDELLRRYPIHYDAERGEGIHRAAVRDRLVAFTLEEANAIQAEKRVQTEVARNRARRSVWVHSMLYQGTTIQFAESTEEYRVPSDIPGPVRVYLDPDSGKITCQTA